MKIRFSNLLKFTVINVLIILSFLTFLLDDKSVSANSVSTLYGSITTSDGTGLNNVRLLLDNSNPLISGCTDENGNYSLQTPSGASYRMQVFATTQYGSNVCKSYVAPPNSIAPQDFYFMNYGKFLDFDLTNGNKQANFVIPTVKLTVIAKDVNGNIIPDKQAFTRASTFYESAIVDGGDDNIEMGKSRLRVQQLDSNGQVSGYVVKGTKFVTDSICVRTFVITDFCNQQPITMDKDTTIIVRMRPSAPTNLVISTVAQKPVLTWAAAEGASSYKIYRDGQNIGTTSSTSFTDSSVYLGGEHNYTVSSLNEGGESPASEAVKTTVDTQPPVITYSLSSPLNSSSWTNQSETITFTCSDEVSGVQSCSPPVQISSEGKDQTVIGIAIDNAGNTSSVTAKASIDKTAPLISNISMSNTLVLPTTNLVISAKASDALSGVSDGEYYIDTDPGTGKAMPVSYGNGQLKTTTTLKGLSAGQHKLFMRVKDQAGNWSKSSSISFTAMTPLNNSSVKNIGTIIVALIMVVITKAFLLF